ncbi:minor tail protein [Arthrobacter phage Cupello]|nr:minor tail protein [Arthrobacter phage Cupello]
MVALLAELRDDGPWAGLTITGLGLGTDVLTVWRTAGGERFPVKGARGLSAIDSAYVIDYEVPLGLPVTYELEFLSGPDTGATATDSLTVESACGYIHDPLDPSVVVPVWATRAPNGEPVLAGTAFAELVRGADVEVHRVLGSSYPVAIGGQRQAATGVDLSLLSDAEVQNTRLRGMVSRATVLVVRPLPGWLHDALPPVGYVSVPEVLEQPLTPKRVNLPEAGRYLTRWEIIGQYVRPSSASVLIALFTYQDVEALFETYAQKQASAGSGTYLDDQKNPLGA